MYQSSNKAHFFSCIFKYHFGIFAFTPKTVWRHHHGKIINVHLCHSGILRSRKYLKRRKTRYVSQLMGFWYLSCFPGMKIGAKFWRSSLIRVFLVWYSYKHFVNFSSDKQHLIWEQKESVFQILEHLPYVGSFTKTSYMHFSKFYRRQKIFLTICFLFLVISDWKHI